MEITFSIIVTKSKIIKAKKRTETTFWRQTSYVAKNIIWRSFEDWFPRKKFFFQLTVTEKLFRHRIKPELKFTCLHWPLFWGPNFHICKRYKGTSEQRPPANNGHNFGVPREIFVHEIDCVWNVDEKIVSQGKGLYLILNLDQKKFLSCNKWYILYCRGLHYSQ